MSNDLLELTKKAFDLESEEPSRVAALTLAYIGDAVYEVIIRTVVISHGDRSINAINKENIGLVNAATQAALSEVLSEDMTEEENAQFRRGRNAKSTTAAKNASVADYRKATGFEAMIGFLYLSGRMERAVELCKLGLEKLGKFEKKD